MKQFGFYFLFHKMKLMIQEIYYMRLMLSGYYLISL